MFRPRALARRKNLLFILIFIILIVLLYNINSINRHVKDNESIIKNINNDDLNLKLEVNNAKDNIIGNNEFNNMNFEEDYENIVNLDSNELADNEENNKNNINGDINIENVKENEIKVEEAELKTDNKNNIEEAELKTDNKNNIEEAELKTDNKNNIEEAELKTDNKNNIEEAELKTDNKNNIEEAKIKTDNKNNIEEKMDQINNNNNKKTSIMNSNNNNNNNNNNNIINLQKKKTDDDYIKGYNGGEIEPEWEWAKSMSIVYSWVDGSDVDFLDVKSKYNNGFRTFNSRDRSADELRYSLRSVEKYMPWHQGTIYIVTANQIPKWLNTTNPRIKLVYHKDFIPEHYFPTFDSNTIELFLDKIPGITERFLYFNDDIFINNYIHPCFFFTSNGFYPKVYRRNPVLLTQEKTDSIINNNRVVEMFHATKFFTRKVIQEYFDPDFKYRYLLHTVYSLYRDLMQPFRELFADEIKVICSDRFRSYYEIQVLYTYQSYLYYATQHKNYPIKLNGIGKTKKFIGKPLPNNRTIQKYSSEMVPANIGKKYIHFGSITNNLNKNIIKFNSFRNDTNLYVYNFNDEYSKQNSLYQFTQYMITRYPEPAPFEKKEYVDLEISYLPKINKTITVTDEMAKLRKMTKEKLEEEHLLNQLKIVNEYLDKKDALSEPKKEISVREEKEINLLLNYYGNELEKEWQWASDISIVYILDDISSNCNCTYGVDRLKYSLRSISKYMPWHKGKIFIIYQNIQQKDELSWLNTEQTRVELIDKNDILPEEVSFTHNKHIIEFYMDKINGISERFIYFNDHHFFTYFIHPQFFFNSNYYPKYNLKNALGRREEKSLMKVKEQKDFVETYRLIFDAFHKNYVKNYRYLYDMPCPLYRDLFEPVRQLYQEEWTKFIRKDQNKEKDTDILPLYLIVTYNIYGTDQPFFPEYVAGYGNIRKAEPPVLSEERNITYYGFDTTSEQVIKATVYPELYYRSGDIEKSKSIKELIHSEKLFFSLGYKNKKELMKELNGDLLELLNMIYEEKSIFEN